ncbi:hypothetical protein [Nocardia sp. NPDC051750]|uniref:hypothetical protein n=1 Tax=Nocardia sp. NPDC051750 TaxID=3364325 RepID=UPI0037961891
MVGRPGSSWPSIRAGTHTPGNAEGPAAAGLDACGEVVEVAAADVTGDHRR